jgi:hypothetical protein
MRVTGPGAPVAAEARRVPGRVGDDATFTLPSSRAGGLMRGAAVGVTALASLDAVLALQGLPDATERRRRAVRHGHALLDGLEELRLALLDGSLPPATLRQLARRRGPLGEAQLDAVLDEIELRAAVELAKLERDGVAC